MKKIKKLLIISKIPTDFKCKNPKDFLFLGDWCKSFPKCFPYSDKIKVVQNHWESREKMKSDSIYLQNLHTRLMKPISMFLNQYHKIKKSEHFWLICVGPWLFEYISILYDRWEQFAKAIRDYKIKNVITSNVKKNTICNYTSECTAKYFEDDWNANTFLSIAKFQKIQEKEIKTYSNKQKNLTRFLKSLRIKINIKSKILLIISKIGFLLKRNEKYFITQSYLSFKNKILINRLLGQLPLPTRFNFVNLPQITARKIAKKPLKLSFRKKNKKFEKFLCANIVTSIPAAFLEYYKSIQNKLRKKTYPSSIKSIFTSNAFFYNDIFKIWAAGIVEKKGKLILGQHGGFYGTCDFGSFEWLEAKISNLYLSWGWTSRKHKNILPLGYISAHKKAPLPNPRGRCLLIQNCCLAYNYTPASLPTTMVRWESEQSKNIQLVKSLPQEISKEVIIRPFLYNRTNSDVKKWQTELTTVRFDLRKKTIYHLINIYRLAIVCYHGTPMLELLFYNFPCIMFWDKDHYEIRNESKKYFLTLRKAKLLFHDPDEAAKHVSGSWERLSDWWYSKEVQTARSFFCGRYVRQNPNLVADIKKILSI